MTRFSDRMERIREDLIRRAHMERSDAMERGAANSELEHTPTEHEENRRGETYVNRLAAMFSRPRGAAAQSAATSGTGENAGQVESPKSPDHGTTLPAATGQQDTNSEPTVAEPRCAVVSGQSEDTGGEPLALTATQDSDRCRRRGRGSISRRSGSKRRFLFCFPWIQSGAVRKAALHCFTSGIFVLLLAAVYLGLTLTQHVATNELTILLLIIILISTMFFCYNIIRLCLIVVRGDKGSSSSPSRGRPALTPAEMLKTGYAMPRRPIRVVLAQDEEVVTGRDGEANKLTPPAYGFWRESVRLDPDRLYWQRNEAARQQEPERPPVSGSGVVRPPSYASDDGVSYVINAMAPSATEGSGSEEQGSESEVLPPRERAR